MEKESQKYYFIMEMVFLLRFSGKEGGTYSMFWG